MGLVLFILRLSENLLLLFLFSISYRSSEQIPETELNVQRVFEFFLNANSFTSN